MKFAIRLILISFCSYLLPMYMAWWSPAVAAGIIAFLLYGNWFNVFNSGFLGAGLTWFYIAFSVDRRTDSIMSSKIVELMPIDDINMLLIASALIGGIITGLASLTGNSLRKIFVKKPAPSGFYS